MVILDEPYASTPLLEWLQGSQHPVLANAFAKRKVDEGWKLRLVDEEEAARIACSGARIYTCTENALAWLLDHSDDERLTGAIKLFKDKGLMREKLADLSPGFYYKRVGREELAAVDPDELPLPVVLKPNVGFCSMGVYVVESADAWREALDDIAQNEDAWHEMYPESVVGSEDYLIDGFLTGTEYAVDAYYDENGAVSILNRWEHDFAGDEDTSDRLYWSSKQLIDDKLPKFKRWLEDVNEIVGARSFCVHVEARMTDAGIVPIEFNPLRFAGLGGTDMAYFGCGYRLSLIHI